MISMLAKNDAIPEALGEKLIDAAQMLMEETPVVGVPVLPRDVSPTTFKLGEIMEKVLTRFRVIASQKKVTIESWTEEYPTVKADSLYLNAIIDLMMKGALLRCGRAGTISTDVRTEESRVIVTITDDGEGSMPGQKKAFVDALTRGSTSPKFGEYQAAIGIAKTFGGSLEASMAPDGQMRQSLILPRFN